MMNNRSLALIWCIMLSAPMMHAGIGCLAPYGPLGTLDYKEWRLVQNCTCDCERSHIILKGGLCEGCRHRQPTVPLNTPRNIVNMEKIVKSVHLNQLAQYRQKTSSKRE